MTYANTARYAYYSMVICICYYLFLVVTLHFTGSKDFTFLIQIKLSLQRIYQKDYHQTKTKIHLPPDIIANQVAKRCQDMLSDVLYRTYLHQWTCHPEQEDAIRARKTNEILSDVSYFSLHCCMSVVVKDSGSGYCTKYKHVPHKHLVHICLWSLR